MQDKKFGGPLAYFEAENQWFCLVYKAFCLVLGYLWLRLKFVLRLADLTRG